MEQEPIRSTLREVNPNDRLDQIENKILDVLKTGHPADRIIDVPRLQMECQEQGLSARKFSHGFVRLLLHGLLEPRGEFAYVLTEKAGKLKDRVSDFEKVTQLHEQAWQPGVVRAEDTRA